MQELLCPSSEFYLPRHLKPMAQPCALLSTCALPSAAAICADIPCYDLAEDSYATLSATLAPYDALIVNAPKGEAQWLGRLAAQYPDKRFYGLGADIWPALAARHTPLLVPQPPSGPTCTALTLVFSTPRSGSSHVADTLAALGRGACTEHLRGDLVKALTSGYDFDLSAALRRFLDLCAARSNGHVATKLIAGHVISWLDTRPDPRGLAAALLGIKVDVIITDRSDRIAQAISGEIAQLSGVWQKRRGADGQKIAQLGAEDFNFGSAFWRYQNYMRQGHFLSVLATWFPRALRLDFTRDIAPKSAADLGVYICAALGWAQNGTPITPRADHVQPTQSVVAPAFQKAFCAGLHEMGLPYDEKGSLD